MKVIKKQTEHGTRIELEEQDKTLVFDYGGNLDLYWSIYTKDESTPKTFTITKENYGVYNLFERLFQDIDTFNIFDNDDEIPFYIETEQEERDYLLARQHEKEEDRKRYLEYNNAHYNDLYHPEEGKITWHSDETAWEVDNYLEIVRQAETFAISFYTQEDIQGYDHDFKTAYSIPVRFRNSGSSYEPFNCIFMRMYNAMKEVDDVKDIGHQLHMEEYLYEQKLKLVKREKV